MEGNEARIISHNHVLNVAMGGVYHSHAIRGEYGWRIDRIRFEARYFAAIADKLNVTISNASGPDLRDHLLSDSGQLMPEGTVTRKPRLQGSGYKNRLRPRLQPFAVLLHIARTV